MKEAEVVVITRASAGVGRATARAFAQLGVCRIGLLARNQKGLEGARHDVEALGSQGLPILTDVADPKQVEDAARRVEDELGPIDIWVNNAIVTVYSPFKEITPEEFRRVTEVDYLGTVYGTMSALKRMQPRNRGVIVQVGSALAYRAIPLQSAYCGAKHAIRAFTDSLRSELLHDKSNVRLTMVQLPALNTPQFTLNLNRLPNQPQPVPPIYQPEVAANAIVWAAYHNRREVYVGSSSAATIIMGWLFPGLVDRFLAYIGYDSQQTNQPIDPKRPNNLYSPVPGHHGAHGMFNDRALKNSWHLWATTRLWWPALVDTVAGLYSAAVTLGQSIRK
jgi:NADP-dependent 3-hydroxy acid dehydrogenase YdfG